MIVRQTTPEENYRIDELFGIAFEQPIPAREVWQPVDREKCRDCHWAAFTDDTREMMSSILITEFGFHFDGSQCRMGGVGGVSSLPEYRRQGGVRGCFEKALPDMYEKGFDFSYLYPFSTCFYRKFGYENAVQKYQVSVKLCHLTPEPTSGTLRLAEAAHPLTEAFRVIDQVWEKRYNMMVTHTDRDYAWTEKLSPAVQQSFSYVYFSETGKPKAYVTFTKADQPDGRNLVAQRFCFIDREGFSGLLRLFRSLAADHDYAKFQIPAEPAMLYHLPEWAMRGDVQWSLVPAGMVRVVNAAAVLKKAAYIGSGSLRLQLRDAQISQNNGCFSITYADGKAISVERSQDKPDIVMDISTFSALISGVSDFESASQWIRGMEIRNPYARFRQVFYRKPMMITDFF